MNKAEICATSGEQVRCKTWNKDTGGEHLNWLNNFTYNSSNCSNIRRKLHYHIPWWHHCSTWWTEKRGRRQRKCSGRGGECNDWWGWVFFLTTKCPPLLFFAAHTHTDKRRQKDSHKHSTHSPSPPFCLSLPPPFCLSLPPPPSLSLSLSLSLSRTGTH